MTSHPLLPAPPDGYQPAYEFTYPKRTLSLAGAGLLVVVVPLLIGLTWSINSTPLFFEPADLLLLLIITPITILLHEFIHGIAFWLYGYRVTYGVAWELAAAYAGAFHQLQKRNDMLVIALTPLVVLTTLCLCLLMASSRILSIGALMATILNIGGAVGDLYLVWRLLRLPRATLLYDVDAHHMFIFEPFASD
jgi:hypothetical protein